MVPATDASDAGVQSSEVARRPSAVHFLSVPSTPKLDRALIAAWLLGIVLALGLIGRSTAALARRRRSWSRREVLDTAVLVSDDFGPAVVGVFRPQIVLPTWAVSIHSYSLALVLRHETEHRRARDTLLLAACGCAVVICPWNAALWWQLARLRLATEIDCDARVLARGGDARAYATVLVSAAERMLATTTLSPAFVERRTLLERRVLAMSEVRAPRRLLAGLASVAGAALWVAIACATPAPRGASAASPPMPPEFAQSRVGQQEYYPRLVRIDTVDAAGTAWLRGALARYYPSVLAGDTSLAFVTFYVSADGRIVGAAARSLADLGPDTTDAPFPFDAAYTFGRNPPARKSARIDAERAVFQADQDTMFASQVPTRSVLGERVILPREFSYDSLAGTSPHDQFLGADPHAFQRADEVYLKPGMIGPAGIYVNILTLLPGRGGPADFGHRVTLRRTPLTPAAPRPDIEHLGDSPGGAWAVTPDLWATLAHKPAIVIDRVTRRFDDLMALVGKDTVIDVRRVTPAAAKRLTSDSAAAYGAIVVTTKGHRPPATR